MVCAPHMQYACDRDAMRRKNGMIHKHFSIFRAKKNKEMETENYNSLSAFMKLLLQELTIVIYLILSVLLFA